MNKIRRLLPGHDFRDDLSNAPRYSSPSTQLMATHDEPFGQIPEILDPRKTHQLGLGVRDIDLGGDWTGDEVYYSRRQPLVMPATPKYSRASSLYSSKYSPSLVYDVSDFQVPDHIPDTEFQLAIKPHWTDRVRNRMKKIRKEKPLYYVEEPQTFSTLEEIDPGYAAQPSPDLSGPISSALLIRSLARKTVVMRPIDSLADLYPQLIGPILVVESAMVMFALYEVYVVLDGVFQTIRALCLPLILVAKIIGL